MKRLDDVLGYKNLKIYQDSDFFSFSLDSIILANYSSIRLRDKKIVDFCTGNGIVPLILSRRCNTVIDAVEIQEKLYDLAIESIKYNNLEDRINMYCMDIKEFANNPNNNSKYDLVLCNPPYFKDILDSSKNLSYEKSIARHEILLNLDDLCKCSNLILKDNGCLSIVHRTERLMEIIDFFKKYNIEPKRIKYIHESINKESTLVLVEGQKMGHVGLKIDSPLILYDLDNNMTKEYADLQLEVRK
jgi:tRNA1(Val) A37 N6-methylase TrmN6